MVITVKRVLCLLILFASFLLIFTVVSEAKIFSRPKVVKRHQVKKPKVDDRTLIKQEVLRWDDYGVKRCGKLPTLKEVKFSPIKIVANWAVTNYQLLDKNGKLISNNAGCYILKKSSGKWRVTKIADKVCIDVNECKKIALNLKVARKLEVLMWWD